VQVQEEETDWEKEDGAWDLAKVEPQEQGPQPD
jgi:hypothetical protein